MLLKPQSTLRRGLPRIAVALAAGVLQLHLFLVTDLHNHQSLYPSPPSNAPCDAMRSFQGTDTACPACQIARQGSVNSPPQGPAILELPKARSLYAARSIKVSDLPLARPSGRAPPLFSEE